MGIVQEFFEKQDMNLIYKYAKEKGLDAIRKAKDLRSNNLLHAGTMKNHIPLIQYSIEAGISVDSTNVAGDSALILATKNCNLEIIALLVKAGGNVNLPNLHGNTPLHYACFWRLNDIALYLAKTCHAIVKISNNYKRLPIDHTSTVLRDILTDIGNLQGEKVVRAKSLTDALNSAATTLDWNVDPVEIQIEEKIYESEFSSVYTGYYKDRFLGIKVIKPRKKLVDQDYLVLKQEISAIQKIHHPNLANIVCASVSPGWKLSYGLKYQQNGNLYDYLADGSVEFSPQEALQYCIQISKGLIYLHESKPAFIHGNLKTSNILIQSDGTLLLSDYGFKKSVLNPICNEPNIVYNPEWYPPEVLLGNVIEDDRTTDIYAFGMVFYLIITRQELFLIKNPMLLGFQIAVDKCKPEIPAFIPEELALLISECWTLQPSLRPSIRSIYNCLLQFNFEMK